MSKRTKRREESGEEEGVDDEEVGFSLNERGFLKIVPPRFVLWLGYHVGKSTESRWGDFYWKYSHSKCHDGVLGARTTFVSKRSDASSFIRYYADLYEFALRRGTVARYLTPRQAERAKESYRAMSAAAFLLASLKSKWVDGAWLSTAPKQAVLVAFALELCSKVVVNV